MGRVKLVKIDRHDRWKKICPYPGRVIVKDKSQIRISLAASVEQFLNQGGQIIKVAEVAVKPELSMKTHMKGPGTDNWLILRNNGSGLARKKEKV